MGRTKNGGPSPAEARPRASLRGSASEPGERDGSSSAVAAIRAPPVLPAHAIPSIAPDELSRLFAEVGRATAQLQAAHDALLAEVASLKGELAETHRRLERKKRLEALGRVAAGVAHEFRNPLGGIRLTVDALLAGTPSAETRSRLAHVQSAVGHLDRIVQDLLTFTRARSLDRSPVEVAELVRHSLALTFSAADSALRTIIAEGPPELALHADRHALTQVLSNLLLNAHQALGPRPGRIGVWWGNRGPDRVWLEVADDGPGIPAGEEEQVFELFHSRREGGTGLGLAIAHERIEAHDGEIAVVHDAWGTPEPWPGARFRILLPVLDPRKAE